MKKQILFIVVLFGFGVNNINSNENLYEKICISYHTYDDYEQCKTACRARYGKNTNAGWMGPHEGGCYCYVPVKPVEKKEILWVLD